MAFQASADNQSELDCIGLGLTPTAPKASHKELPDHNDEGKRRLSSNKAFHCGDSSVLELFAAINSRNVLRKLKASASLWSSKDNLSPPPALVPSIGLTRLPRSSKPVRSKKPASLSIRFKNKTYVRPG